MAQSTQPITQTPRKRAASVHRAAVELRALAPFDFELVLNYLRIWPAAILEKIDTGRYRRAVTLDGRDVLLSIHSIGTPSRPRLVLEVFGAGVDQPIIERAAALVRRTFSLDADPAPFLKAAQADPVLAQVVGRLHALRPIMIIDPFEAALWSILGQQINLAFARRLKQSLIELRGSHLEINGERFGLFPKPAQVAGLDPDLARERQFSRQKVEYVRGVAAAVLSGKIDFELMRNQPAEEAFDALIAVKGIGRWTAEYLLIRALGFPDAIPAADVGLRKAIGIAYGLGRTATEAEVRERSAKWSGWRGWAAFYWWLDRLLAREANLTSGAQTTT